MNIESTVKLLSALAHETRLSVVPQLIKNGEMSAGDLATSLNATPSTLSAHLKDLKATNIISSTKKGRFIHYRANIQIVGELIGFLFLECCNGQPEACLPQLEILNVLKGKEET